EGEIVDQRDSLFWRASDSLQHQGLGEINRCRFLGRVVGRFRLQPPRVWEKGVFPDVSLRNENGLWNHDLGCRTVRFGGVRESREAKQYAHDQTARFAPGKPASNDC